MMKNKMKPFDKARRDAKRAMARELHYENDELQKQFMAEEREQRKRVRAEMKSRCSLKQVVKPYMPRVRDWLLVASVKHAPVKRDWLLVDKAQKTG